MEKLIEVLPTTARRRIIRLTSGLVMSGFDKDGAAFPWRDSPILIRVDDAPIMEVLEEASPNKIGGPIMPTETGKDCSMAQIIND